MLENHQIEQFFWDLPTLEVLADVAARFENPACLCAPFLGRELEKRGVECAILDLDERFCDSKNFQKWDLYRPQFLKTRFGAIFCDPPFWKVSLSQLFPAIRLLSHHDDAQKLAICYPTRRGANLCATFARFDLRPTGFFPTYNTVDTSDERGKIEFFANFDWNEEVEAPLIL